MFSHPSLKMKTHKLIKATLLSAFAMVLSSAHAGSYGSGKNVVAVASEAGSFNTLVAAIKAAGLADTLQGQGPFTVFAPTDEAFAKLPAGTVNDLLKPENKAKLAAILTYHVVPGKVMAADVKTMSAKTVNGQTVDLRVSGSTVTIDEAKIVKTDIPASNGVIHIIDTVILPE